jgi:carboxyl-terminal processing protease
MSVRRPTPVAVLTSVALLVVLASLPPATATPPRAMPASKSLGTATTHRLSAKARKEIFDKVGKEIQERYYDPAFNGVDWDAVQRTYFPEAAAARNDQEYYAVLSRMTSELHDVHTRFSSPDQWNSVKRREGVGAGFSVDEIDGKTVVTSVRARSSAAEAGLEPGMILVTVDGHAVSERVAELQRNLPPSSSDRATRLAAYGRLLGGAPGSTFTAGLQKAGGAKLDVTLTRRVYSVTSSVTAYRLPSGNAYIRFDGFDPAITKEFREALVKFRDAPGVLLDLRRNGGGELSVLMPIAGYFFDRKTLFAKDATRSGKPLSEFAGIFKLPLDLYVGKKGDQVYSSSVAILVDARSASSAEVFAAGMQETHRATIVGDLTCGCVLGIAKPRMMKGGGVLEISEVLWFSPQGRKLEGAGVTPDEAVVPRVVDLQQRRDAAVQQADAILLREAGAAQRASRQ